MAELGPEKLQDFSDHGKAEEDGRNEEGRNGRGSSVSWWIPMNDSSDSHQEIKPISIEKSIRSDVTESPESKRTIPDFLRSMNRGIKCALILTLPYFLFGKELLTNFWIMMLIQYTLGFLLSN